MSTVSRFIKVYAEGNKEGTEIWVDRVTGVNYVFHYRGYMEGFTPLLDEDGKPVITPVVDGEELMDDRKVS
ncbi:MAG: hypothetical protein E7292_10930 [Lachnospiraceae bacterium]|nr:hypothetical protein [Lachnospiraceae bacterium]